MAAGDSLRGFALPGSNPPTASGCITPDPIDSILMTIDVARFSSER
jgi:hypothetical protein